MAAPKIEAVFPNNESNNVPVGADIEVTFDKGIDLPSAKTNCVLYGADFDRSSGPSGAQWLNESDSKLFLRSPGFSGVVECNYRIEYVNNLGEVVENLPQILDRDAEIENELKCKLIISPKELLAKEVEYTAYFIGDSEGGTSKGISSRTVFDTSLEDVTSDTGSLQVYGGYTGSADTILNIKITTAGDLGKAKYEWWYDVDGENSAVKGRVTSRRWRRLADGLQLRWSGSNFIEGDIYRFKIYSPDFMKDSLKLQFSTGTGSIIEVPKTASTSVIGTIAEIESFLEVVNMNPPDGATHQKEKKKIVINFNKELDPETVTDESVAVFAYPVSGVFDGPSGTNDDEVKELFKKLTVENKQLIIDIA